MIRRLITLCALASATALLGACTTEGDESVPVANAEPSFHATFRPSMALVPFPNDMWRSGSTDGTLNIYAGNEKFQSDPLIGHVNQLNLLDGFGLNAPVYADFSHPVDQSSLALGESVVVMKVMQGGAPVAPTPVMTFEVGTAGFQGGRSVIELKPTEPLEPLTTYAVILTRGIKSSSGENASADTAFQAMVDAFEAGETDLGDATLNALYAQMVQPILGAVDGTIGAENVVAAWTFTTQSVGASFAALQAAGQIQPRVSGFAPLLRNPENPAEGIRTAGELLMPASDLNEDGTPDIGLNADVYAGVINLPYYSDVENPLSGFWTPVAASCDAAIGAELIQEASASTTAYCPLPEQKATLAVPVLLAVPNAHADNAACSGMIAGVTIFQHGITGDRTHMLPAASALAQACQAAIAIDLPLHGLVDSNNPMFASAEKDLYVALAGAIADGAVLTEQTLNLDVDGDGKIDSSGAYFINLESPITARDAIRQGAVNLMNLVASIPNIDYNFALDGGASGPDFAGLPVSFVGHSLGGITGTVFLGATADPTVASVLAMPGGGIAELILDSESIYPQVRDGLAENGLTEGMRFLDEFFRNAQTLVEDADPVNYAAAAAANTNTLLLEVVGGAGSSPDQVVPNSATDRLGEAMGLTRYGPGNHMGAGLDAWVQFSAGDHGSILNPAASAAVTQEMQTEMAAFISTGGAVLPVGSVDPSVIVPQE